MNSSSIPFSPIKFHFPLACHSQTRSHLPIKPHVIPTLSHSLTTNRFKKNKPNPNQNPIFLETQIQENQKEPNKNNPQPNQNPIFLQTQIQETEIEPISDTMWWVDLKAALGQRINFEGIFGSVSVIYKDKHLALPHIGVPDISYIDWSELKRRGFEGVVFDKDNTITVPYSLALWGPLGESMERCKAVFGDNIAVLSNSAGLLEYDIDGRKAKSLEGAIGIKVIRHRLKKPAGTAEEIEGLFGCDSSRLIMVGDRPFTDIVYGNRNDFLTILTEPLSLVEEPFIVKQVRKIEVALVNRWSNQGIMPITHSLIRDPMRCVRDLPPQ